MSSSEGVIFPDEVVIQILAKLPIKSLFRAKTVCKVWYRLCCEKYFIHMYNDIAVKNSMVLIEVTDSVDLRPSLLCVDSSSVSEFSLGFLRDRVKVRASCNGLLCCSSVRDRDVYYVCNPMTREYRLLPRSRERPVTRFHPDGEATLVGLACDMARLRFSVVLAGYYRTFGHRTDGTFVCLVFDSETNRWRKFCSTRDDQFTHMNKNQVVFVNNALHWLTRDNACILVLDLKCDAWRRISLPAELSSASGNRVYLLESDGCLSVIQISDAWMCIWALKEYEIENWIMVQRVSLRCIRALVPSLYPISQGRGFVFLATRKQVLVYHLKTRVWKEMYSVKYSSNLPLWFSAYAFCSTLFPCN